MFKYLSIVLLVAFFNKGSCPTTYVLIAKPKTIVGCGGILVAGQFLFINAKDSTQIMGIIKCPDGYGDVFFKEDAEYNIEFAKDTVLGKEYSLMNVFETPPHKKIPIRIIEKIEIEKN